MLPLFHNPSKRAVDELFLHLNPLFSFVDYDLLQHIIRQFGNNMLNKDMSQYHDDMQVFMKQTTIKDLINILPGVDENEIRPQFNLEVLKTTFGSNTGKYTLDTLRRDVNPVCIGIYTHGRGHDLECGGGGA